MAGLTLSINGRFWVSTEQLSDVVSSLRPSELILYNC